ncbi:MAG: hypothetical protein U0990_12660 [Candidatus Nanopelagicales bacterium]|nr:hypothetical protein [Candidatus Nanopelagicales bacterium]
MQKVQVYDGSINEIRAAPGTAGGGLAITSTRQYISLIPGANWCSLTARNFASSAEVVEFAYNPFLTFVFTQDGLDTPSWDEALDLELQDGDTIDAKTLTFNTLANGDFLLIGSRGVRFGGFNVDLDTSVNNNASVMAVHYYRAGDWVALTVADGTDSGGASMAVDGDVTWTMPVEALAWEPVSLNEIYSKSYKGLAFTEPMYWVRVSFSVALDSIKFDQIRSINRNGTGGEIVSGQAVAGMMIEPMKPGGVGNISALTDTGTANLIVNVGVVNGTFPLD